MSKEKWRVSHPERETVEVDAKNRADAIICAAHAWGFIHWSDACCGGELKRIKTERI